MSEVYTKTAGQGQAIAKEHFRMFDTLRFFAFLKVFLQHIPIAAFAWFNVVRAGGKIGVQFFFVLSGFLITYIIFNEKKQTGTYSLKNFFVRRILRIWPLFYLVVILCYCLPFVLHQPKVTADYQPTWWVSMFFLENYKIIFTHSLPNVHELAITWSLCIEEHFYVMWGLLLWVLPVKAFPKVAACCIIVGLAARLIFFHYGLDPIDLSTNVDLFAFGAIPAYLLVFYSEQVELFLQKIPRNAFILCSVFVVTYVLIVAQSTGAEMYSVFIPTASGILFSILIFLSLHNKNLRPVKMLEKAGVYTYGLYMYHLLIIILFVRLFAHFHLTVDKPINALLFFTVTLAGTIGFSILSYNYFEKPFLKLKRFFR